MASLCIQTNLLDCSVSAAAFAVRFYSNEMVFANTTADKAAARAGLNTSSSILRTWHERLLFASSTNTLIPGSVHYTSHAVAGYRATPLVEKVSQDSMLTMPALGLSGLLALGKRSAASADRSLSLSCPTAASNTA